jgi:hypothetical protein
MSQLDTIVQVTITVQDTAVTQAGFGLPMVMDYHTNWLDRTRLYSSTDAMVSDGFNATDPAVVAVGKILGQNPKLGQVMIGRRDNATDMKIIVTVLASPPADTDFVVTLNGTAFTFDSGATPTPASVALGLVGAINGGSEPVTATDNTDGTFDLDADVAGDLFTLEVDRTLMSQDDQTPDAGAAADYAAIKADTDDFYGVLMTSNATLEIAALAAAVESDRKIFLAQSADDDIPAGTGGNLGDTLDTAGYNRTALSYHPKPHQYLGHGWVGKLFPNNPGEATWKFKDVTGVDVVELSDTEVTNLDGDHVNHFMEISGARITREGWAASGRYLDVTRGIDWLHARMQERILSLLVNVKKVPFTDSGIALVEKEIRAQLQEGISRGVLAADPEPTVTVPLAASVSTANKAARLLPDMQFSATLAGAIHKVVIAGTVSV